MSSPRPRAETRAGRSGRRITRLSYGNGDAGSSLPLVLLCFLIAAVLVAGVTAASSAFLAQRDLQADCDGAAVAAASGIDPKAIYGTTLDDADALPIAREEAQRATAEYQSSGFPDDATLSLTASVDLDRVTVVCTRVVKVPFGAFFGIGAGLDRSTVSTARSPLTH